MSEEPKNAVAKTSRSELATMPLADAIEAYTPQFADALPDHIPLQRFKRTVLTALNQNPDLAKANRHSLFLACVKCAHDGLYPDGREAALVTFGGAVVYLPMIAGIRKLMRNTGEVLSATAEVVHRNDHFHYVKGENPRIEHEPPPLDKERGDAIGAYAIIKLANGETLREVMGLHEIERVRSFSRTGRSKGSPWETSWPEMARKTVLRRCAKSAPTGSDQEFERIHQAFARDDEEPEGAKIPSRPTRQQFKVVETEADKTLPTYELNLIEGRVVDAVDAQEAFSLLQSDMGERASATGMAGLEAFWEDNKELMAQLHADGYTEELSTLTEEYNTLSARACGLNATQSKPEVRSATVAQSDGQIRGQMEEGKLSPSKISSGASSPPHDIDLTKPPSGPTSFHEATGLDRTSEVHVSVGGESYMLSKNPADGLQDRPRVVAATNSPQHTAVVASSPEKPSPGGVTQQPGSAVFGSDNATPPINADMGGKPRFAIEPITKAPGSGIDIERTATALVDMIETLDKAEYDKFRDVNRRILSHFTLYAKPQATRINDALKEKDKEFYG